MNIDLTKNCANVHRPVASHWSNVVSSRPCHEWYSLHFDMKRFKHNNKLFIDNQTDINYDTQLIE
jgi:hypothetical protein